MNLDDIRLEIDQIDMAIFEQIAKRLRCVEKVVCWKQDHNMPIYDPKRESYIIDQKRQLAQNYGFSADTAEEILRAIIAESHMQEKKFLTQDQSSPRKIRRKKIENHPPLLTIFKQIAQKESHFFFLESLGDDQWNNQSFLGFRPIKRFAAKGKNVFIDDVMIGTFEDPILWLEEQFLPYQNIIPGMYTEGFCGGMVGHINFEAVKYLEPSLSLKSHDHFYDFEFGLFLDGLVYDRKLETLEYVFCDIDRSDLVYSMLAQEEKSFDSCHGDFIGQSMSDTDMEEMIDACKKEIVAGNVFQIVPSQQYFYKFTGSELDFYEKLRIQNPSPNMFFLHFDTRKLIGSSPEMIAKVQGRRIETYPIAGTRSRGKTPQEDAKLSAQMLADEKEVAEHLMLVDMARNDLGKVCEFGSVKAEEIMALKKYSVVQHLVSRVVGKIKPNISALRAALANFPMGTVSGSPRLEAIEILQKMEQHPRGPYAGGVGYWSITGDMQMTLAIRALFIHDHHAIAQAGAGVVFDSIAEYERREIEKKSQHIRSILSE